VKSLVSIIVPCYNQAEYLPEALQSVIEQSFSNWECIIVNDGSSDNTEEVAKKFIKRDGRFKYILKENGGLSSARNMGISGAIGSFILPLDADDKIAADYSELALAKFKKDPELKVVYCKAEKFGNELGAWELPDFSLHKLSRQNMIFCSAIFKKDDWKRVGGYDEKIIFGWEDWDFWISILKNGGKVCRLDRVGFYYRKKPTSMLKEISPNRRAEIFKYLNIKHADFFVEYYGSFSSMNIEMHRFKREFNHKLKSEKFVIDLFCKKFFGFSVFGKYK